MKTAAFLVIVGALTGCGPAPVSLVTSSSDSQVGRYAIYYARDPSDPRLPLVMKLDTVTGAVEQLNVVIGYEHGPDGYADTNKPVPNRHGSFAGGLYWSGIATMPSEADFNKYRPDTKPPYSPDANE